MQHLDDVRNMLADVLGLGDRKAHLDADSPLLGSVPELDSMAVISVIAAIEDWFGVTVDDDEINASVFRTLGTLAEFVDAKLALTQKTA
ncbi:acyl carrier protein [Noviherbaspirillum galbum]|uniref:Acyl carrier protein n=1 Tax=Noviherbaspirillum galbum TaxID=2709383 RepID=A0A6B3STX6_9BURK|nr:acyl carrier protein [Noviherbaspirillum galbum]NEX64134.1 acyl carrier protein [Noviherbaspirillum galbum]